MEWVHGSFGCLVALLERVGLQTNGTKTKSVVCTSGFLWRRQEEAVYHRWVVILGAADGNTGGGINTPPNVHVLLYASAATMGAYNPPADRKLLAGSERRIRRLDLERISRAEEIFFVGE